MAAMAAVALLPAATWRPAGPVAASSRSSSFFAATPCRVALRAPRVAFPSRHLAPTMAMLSLEEEADMAVKDDKPKYPAFAAFKIHGTGRRKTAVARVGLIEGTGRIYVNGLTLNAYFQNQALMVQTVKLPLSSLGYETKYDLVIKTHGGGLSAQSQAMVLGIARALVVANPDNKPPLKAQGMMTRDARAVERKKAGLKKARKAPQYSKR